VDGAIVVFSLAVVRNGLLGEGTTWPWALVILFTLGTIVLNGIHSDGRIVSVAVAVVAPIALVLAFETSMAMVKSDVRRGGLVRSIAEIETESKKKRAELDKIEEDWQAEMDALTANGQSELANLQSEIGQLQDEITAKANTLNSYTQDVEAKKIELKGLSGGLTKIYLPANLSLEQKQDLANQMAKDGLTNEQVAIALGVSLATVKNYKRANRLADPADVTMTTGGENGKSH
jgi:septal ring factor EnvC (AmiA/AmiB activator)